MAFGKMGAHGGFGSLGSLGKAGIGLSLPKFKAALARGAGSPARIMIVGHSHIGGEGAGTGGLGLIGASPLGWVQQLSGNLAGKITADCHSFFGDQNAPAGSVTFPQMDPRVTFGTSGWSDDVGASTMGARFIIAPSGNTGPLTFTPGFTFSSAKLWYPQLAGVSTSVAVSVNGALQTTINETGANALASVTINATGTNISLVNNGSAQAYLEGIECFRATQQAVISYSGWLGAFMSDISSNLSGNPWGALASETAYNADLVLIQCMINDINSNTAAATWQASATTLRNAVSANADVVFIIDPVCNGVHFTDGLYDQYVTAAKALGQTIDMRQALGASYAAANAAGYMFDANHPNATGHSLCSQLVARILKASM